MDLLGWPLLAALIVLAATAPAGCLLAWNRLPGPRAVRAAGRLGLVATCQVTALLLAATLINRNLHLYASWDDLLGSGNVTGGDIQAAGTKNTPRGPFRFDRRSRTYVAHPVGATSGIRAEVRVWLPEEYATQPGKRFPVIELFPGFPGSSWTWFGAMKAAEKLRATPRAKPVILVAPTITVQPGRDTECTDIPGGPKVATWLTTDVRRVVTEHFRALPDAWATMGYSTGGFCAVKIAAQHPASFKAAVSLAGYFRPTAPDLLRSPPLLRANSPLDLLDARPPVDLLLAGSREDPGTVTALDALLPRVKPPTRAFTYIVATGGHNVRVWREMLPRAYSWLSARLPDPT